MVNLLIYKNAAIDAMSDFGTTPLLLACNLDDLDIINRLLISGANVNFRNAEGNTALHILSKKGNEAAIRLVSKFSPDYFILNKYKEIPEDIAKTVSTKKLLCALSGNTPDSLSNSRYSREIMNNVIIPNNRADMIKKLILYGSKINGEDCKIGLNCFLPLKMLGKGTFGKVFLVRYMKSGELFAMKILSKRGIKENNIEAYALAERNILHTVKHPFIVQLYLAFQTQDYLCLLLEYCPGGTLKKKLSKEKKFSEDLIRCYTAEIILGIEHLHKHNIMYRDLKPENICLDREGHAMLIDFGLGKEAVYNDSVKSFVGSVAYLPPEILRKELYGKAADWYLLGMLIYELLEGRPAYYSKNIERMYEKKLMNSLLLPKTVSPECQNLLLKLIHSNPKKRLGSGGAEEIKMHPFYRGIDWKQGREKRTIASKART